MPFFIGKRSISDTIENDVPITGKSKCKDPKAKPEDCDEYGGWFSLLSIALWTITLELSRHWVRTGRWTLIRVQYAYSYRAITIRAVHKFDPPTCPTTRPDLKRDTMDGSDYPFSSSSGPFYQILWVAGRVSDVHDINPDPTRYIIQKKKYPPVVSSSSLFLKSSSQLALGSVGTRRVLRSGSRVHFTNLTEVGFNPTWIRKIHTVDSPSHHVSGFGGG